MKEKKIIRYNLDRKWGGLVNPEDHDAAVGIRIADNRYRDFGIFDDRMTVFGEEKAAYKLQKWLFSKKTLNRIKANTSFRFGLDPSFWATMENVGNLRVTLDVVCKGEYAYICAYADVIQGIGYDICLLPSFDKHGQPCWQIGIRGEWADYPMIHAVSKECAKSVLVDYIANELRGKDDMYP